MGTRNPKTVHRANGQFGKRRFGKYNAKGERIDDIWFASAAEATRYRQLKDMLEHKKITLLECQPVYRITVDGKHICNYRADFRYVKLMPAGSIGGVVVEDVKGMRTDVYMLKRKLFEARFKITLHEIPGRHVHKYAGKWADESVD
jgi:hypothetical protein